MFLGEEKWSCMCDVQVSGKKLLTLSYSEVKEDDQLLVTLLFVELSSRHVQFVLRSGQRVFQQCGLNYI